MIGFPLMGLNLNMVLFFLVSPGLPRIQIQVRPEEAARSHLMATPPVLELLVRTDGHQARSQRSHRTIAEVRVCAHHL